MTDATCSVTDCGRPAEKRTWCAGHYRRWQRRGDVNASVPLRRLNAPVVNGLRQCSHCDEFRPASSYIDGHARCLPCRRERMGEWESRNPGYYREWQRANPDSVNATVQMRRAARLSLPRERVERAVVFARDGFCCQLCGDPLDMDARRSAPFAPTLDHIVPLSKGGHHTYANTQAAHFRCNTSKGARTP